MPELDDIALLKQFAENDSESAFAEIVSRHLNLVYSTALRSVGNAHAAQEISQAVFIILARKAKSLGAKTVLSGWLYQTTRLTAANFLRTEIRRQKREQEAFMQSILNESESEAWLQIAPILDDAISKLGARDRDAIVLRFFENKNLREVGAALGASEDAAKMRVNRALEKLRKIFSKRGATFSAVAIAGAVSANSVQAAPVGLAQTISAVAIAKGAAAGGSTLALVKGALKIMAWTKMKTAIVVGVVALLAVGTTTTLTIKSIQKNNDDNYPWQTNYLSSELLEKAPPMLKIVPTKFPNSGVWVSIGDGRILGIGQDAEDLIEAATEMRSTRTVFLTKLPNDKYDFIASLPSGSEQALQNELKKKFHVAGKLETLETNVLILTIKNPTAERLEKSASSTSYSGDNPGHLSFTNQPISKLAEMLENRFRIPVIDQTGLANNYDFDVTWDEYGRKVGYSFPDYPNLNGLKRALLDQLGLELMPTNMPIEMLVVEKAK
jgi:uncharacterized protein (TIGR03435 family)